MTFFEGLKSFVGAAFIGMTALTSAAAETRQQQAPLPPRRPPEFAAPKAAPSPPLVSPQAGVPLAAPPGDDAETCAAVLASGNVVANAMPAIHSGLCGIEHPLMLKAIVVADRREIKLEPPVALRCQLAAAIADWVSGDVAPAVAATGQPLAALSGVGGYECRGRDGVAGAKLSEHAIGNAFDISGLKRTDGKIIAVHQPDAKALFEKVRASACARFSTVLGPGSDGFHKTHVHVDLQARRHGNKLCQWELEPAASPPADQAAQKAADKPPDAAEKKK
jgi:hypothetical protein